MRRIFFAATLCLLLTACWMTKLTQENESNIRTVSLDMNVKVPEKPGYQGPTMGGGLIDALAAYRTVTRIHNYMNLHKIDISKIVLVEFEKQVREHPKFVNKRFVNDPDQADARFELKIVEYGLMWAPSFSFRYRPLLTIRARLVSDTGKTLWEREVPALNCGTPSYTLHEYFRYSGNMREAYQEAAKQVVSGLMKSLSNGVLILPSCGGDTAS